MDWARWNKKHLNFGICRVPYIRDLTVYEWKMNGEMDYKFNGDIYLYDDSDDEKIIMVMPNIFDLWK